MANAKVSIIIPVYNSGEMLKRTLKSVLAQTYTNFEVILIDDGSTDVATRQLVDEISSCDKRIKAIHQENIGVYGACDKGIKLAEGKYVYVSGQDDYLHPQLFELCIHACESYDLDYLAIRWNNISIDTIPTCKLYNWPQDIQIDIIDNKNSETNRFCHAIEFVHIDAWAQFMTKDLSLRSPSKQFGQITRTIKSVYESNRWGVIKNPLYFYSVDNASSIMHKPIYPDWVRELNNELVNVYDLTYAPESEYDARIKFLTICKKHIVSGMKTVYHLMVRSNKHLKFKAKIDLLNAFSTMVRDLLFCRKIPIGMIGFRRYLKYVFIGCFFGKNNISNNEKDDNYRGSSSRIS